MKRHVLDVNSLVELVHNDHGLITGFSLRSFKKELAVMDHHSNHYYIIYLLEGSIDLSCSLYSKKLVSKEFVPSFWLKWVKLSKAPKNNCLLLY